MVLVSREDLKHITEVLDGLPRVSLRWQCTLCAEIVERFKATLGETMSRSRAKRIAIQKGDEADHG